MQMQVFLSLYSISLSPNIPRRGLPTRPFICCQAVRLSNTNERNSDARAFKAINFRASASGTVKSSSEAVEATPTDVDMKDGNLYFVAGATGTVSRTVRELLK